MLMLPSHQRELNCLIGDWGKFQTLVFIFAQFAYFVNGWQSLELVFLVPTVEVECADNVTTCSSQCQQHNFSRKDFAATLTEKLDLICDRSWLGSLSTTLLMVGGLVMIACSGYLADRFGRKKTILLCGLLFIIGSIIILLNVNYVMLAVGVILVGMVCSATSTFAYVLLFELMGEGQRALVGVSMELGFSCGATVLGAVAWGLRHWFWLHLVTLAVVCLLTSALLLPESPSWLLSKGRKKDAVETIKRIRKVNKLEDLNEAELEAKIHKLSERISMTGAQHEFEKTYSMADLFLNQEYRFKTFCVCYFWFTAGLVFFGVSLHTDFFGGELYLSYLLSAVSTIPSVLLVLAVVRVWSLRTTLIVCNALLALVCFLYLFASYDVTFRTTIVVFSWCLIAPALIMLFTYTAEMYPTTLRGKATGLGCSLSRLGAALAPFAKEMGSVTHDFAPMLLFSCCCALQVLLMVKLEAKKAKVVVAEQKFAMKYRKSNDSKDHQITQIELSSIDVPVRL